MRGSRLGFRPMYATVVCLFTAPVLADTVTLPSAADNTLYQSDTGATSNGAGQYMFAGLTATGEARRACILFDVSSIPPGSTINSVMLTLNLSRSITDNQVVEVHRLLASWGEGASLAPGNEGSGGETQPGDATWIHRFFDTSFWATPGGDFSPTVSASQLVGFTSGPVVWSGPGLVADVQAWLDGSAANHGWSLNGDETVAPSAKRFDTKENIVPSFRPSLRVNFTPPPCDGDYDGDLDADFADITFVLANFNNPFVFSDITVVLANFGNDCGARP